MTMTPTRRWPRVPLARHATLVGAILCGSCAPTEQPAREAEVIALNEDAGAGAVIGLQLAAHARDYASEESFRALLDAALAPAVDLLDDKTLVVLPEYTGTWLVAVDEGAAVRDAPSPTQAMIPLIAAHPQRFALAHCRRPAEDAQTYAVFALKAERMAEVYQRVLSAFAAEHQVTVVGGSILLPGPAVDDDGAITVEAGGPLFNASFVFGPDGALLGPPVIKAFPTRDEQAFVAAGDPADLPVFDTPVGRVAVLVCADAWYPASYEALAGRDVEVVAVPILVSPAGKWTEAWGGYSGHPAPDDVDLEDIGALTEQEAWQRYGAQGRAKAMGAPVALTVPMRGAIWDLDTDGAAHAVRRGETFDAPQREGHAALVLWR